MLLSIGDISDLQHSKVVFLLFFFNQVISITMIQEIDTVIDRRMRVAINRIVREREAARGCSRKKLSRD